MKLTELEYVLLAHLKRRARTGYELGKSLEGLPMGTFSSSPGSIYPALGRLSEAGFVRSEEVPVGRRPRKEFRLTNQGVEELSKWLDATISTEDLLRRPGVLGLRYSFLPDVQHRSAFLREYSGAAKAGLTYYDRYLSEARDQVADGPMAALELVRAMLATHETWSRAQLEKVDPQGDQDSTPSH